MSELPRVIAIDGPAASGKSSTAQAVADALGMVHIDSGSLYRAAALVTLEANADDPMTIAALAEASPVTFRRDGSSLRLVIDGRDIESRIRTPEVTALVSPVSAIPAVRDWVNRLLREAVQQHGPTVMDGRDIGTVVFPEAVLKVYLTATPEARARRRLLQMGQAVGEDAVRMEASRLAERDRRDASRAVAPLRPAVDAFVLDTTEMGFADGVAQIVALARRVGLPDR